MNEKFIYKKAILLLPSQVSKRVEEIEQEKEGKNKKILRSFSPFYEYVHSIYVGMYRYKKYNNK